MNHIRKLFFILTGLALVAFGLPALAAQSQNKTYSLDITVLVQGDSATSSQIQATLTNTSPAQSSSTFSSVDLFVDLGWLVDPDKPVTANETSDPSVQYAADISQNGHIKISNLSPVKPVGKSNNALVVTFWVTSASCGDGSWEANVWSGSQIGSGNVFTRNAGQNVATVACANVACGGQVPFVAAPGGVSVERDQWNKDGSLSGSACDAVSYYASNTLGNYVGLPADILHFRWDDSGTNELFSTAAFKYQVFYATAPTRTRVAWLYLHGQLAINPGANPNANPANPVVFIDAPPCLSQVLPTPYGSLNSPLSANSTTVKIDTSTGSLAAPNPIPPLGFPIYIGQERMQVIAYGSNGWTVQPRGTNGVSHPKNALIMSTPLPLLTADSIATASLLDGTAVSTGSPYATGMQAQVCLAATGVTAPGNVPYNTFIDIGDGWGIPR